MKLRMLHPVLRTITIVTLAATLFATPALGAMKVDAPSSASAVSAVAAVTATGLAVSPSYQRTVVGAYVSWTLTWSNAPYFNQTFYLHHGDGSADSSYTCFSNCVSGSTIFNYNGYPSGYWGAWATDQNFNGSNLVDVDVR